MTVENLIRYDIEPLVPSDTMGTALHRMEQAGVRHCPVVHNKNLEGLLSEETALEMDTQSTVSGVLHLLSPVSVEPGSHLYTAMQRFGEFRISVLPVVSSSPEGGYLGYITPEDVIYQLGSAFGIQAPGGIFMIRVDLHNYSFSEISQIIESNDAKILTVSVHVNEENQAFDIAIRVNSPDLNAILATFQRYKYTILSAWHEDRYEEGLRERYEQFMNYLNM